MEPGESLCCWSDVAGRASLSEDVKPQETGYAEECGMRIRRQLKKLIPKQLVLEHSRRFAQYQGNQIVS